MTYEQPDPEVWTDSTGYDQADEPAITEDDIPEDELGPADPVDDVADLADDA